MKEEIKSCECCKEENDTTKKRTIKIDEAWGFTIMLILYFIVFIFLIS